MTTTEVVGRYVVAGGLRTYYLEAGTGTALVLLHGGEYGAASELMWAECMPAFAQRFRVLALDLVGFGRSDKVRDFGGGQRRLMIRQVSAVLRALDVSDAIFVGTSLSGRILLDLANRQPSKWPMRAVVASGVGLGVPAPSAREVLENFDGTLEGLKPSMRVLFHDPAWRDSEAYLRHRHEISTLPGAWETAAAAAVRSPLRHGADLRSHVHQPPRDYSGISVPTQLIRGEYDALVSEDTWQALAMQIRDACTVTIAGSGHYPQVERPTRFTSAVLDFLDRLLPLRGDND